MVMFLYSVSPYFSHNFITENIGGQFNVPTRPNMDVIRLNPVGEWSKVGTLPKWRFSFRARAVGNKIFLIGGPDVQTVECWRWNEDETMT